MISEYSFVRFCTSRVEAIKYLMKEEEMNREELHTMREGLISDGWLSSPFLPQVYYSLHFEQRIKFKLRLKYVGST